MWSPCFATLRIHVSNSQMFARYSFAVSPRVAREVCLEILAPEISEGVRSAGRPMRRSPVCEVVVVNMHTSIHSGSTRITRHPRTQWFYGLYVISPVSHALLPPSPRGIRFCPTRLSRTASAGLDASVGASGPHDFTVREFSPAKIDCAACRAEALAKAERKTAPSSCVLWYRSRRAIRPATHRNA